jgi:hypothetical protein
MEGTMGDIVIKRFESPDETRIFDSWVVGDEPYVSLHFLGADAYAKENRHE